MKTNQNKNDIQILTFKKNGSYNLTFNVYLS